MSREPYQINHFYISKVSDSVSVKYVGDENFLKTNDGFTQKLIPINDYFKTQNITNPKLIQQEKQKFFGNFNIE